MQLNSTIARPEASILQTNKVIRNTYILLSMTLFFSGVMAAISTMLVMPPMTGLVTFGAALLLLWLVLPRYANSSAGVGLVFLITGLLGFGLGPMLNSYLQLANGSQLIMTAMGGTGVIFLTLSGYALTTRKDFSFMGGFLMVGMVVAIVAIIANIFLNIPALSLVISAVVIMIMSGFILYDTSRIIHGGETNYVTATIGLYLSILNIFVHLLHLLGVFGGED